MVYITHLVYLHLTYKLLTYVVIGAYTVSFKSLKLVFTFSMYFYNVYLAFYCILFIFYSIYLTIVFSICIYLLNANIERILNNWVVFLSVYYYNYICSKIISNKLLINGRYYDYIILYFVVEIFLTLFTVFMKFSSILVGEVTLLIALVSGTLFKKKIVKEKKSDKKFFFKVNPIKYNYSNFSNFQKIFANFFQLYAYFKNVLIAVLLSFLYMFYTIYFFQIQFLKQLAIWLVIGLIFYWLISGFNFFIKHYQFGKFTSQIQRFWKRTNTYFWLIEGFLILLFFYYFLNSSQEPLYMYDYSALNQEYLVSLNIIYCNTVVLAFIIYLMYIILFQLNFTSWYQQALYLTIVSSFIFFTFFIETYQFYYLLNSFSEKIWVFNEENNMWLLTQEAPIMRCKHYYLMVYLVAKYWHFLFIFLSWVFFMAKNLEKKQTNYVLFGANLQNLILLFILNLSCYAQWLKWFYRRFYDIPYKWFFVSSFYQNILAFFNELYFIYLNLFFINVKFNLYKLILYKSLSVWNVDTLFFWKYI